MRTIVLEVFEPKRSPFQSVAQSPSVSEHNDPCTQTLWLASPPPSRQAGAHYIPESNIQAKFDGQLVAPVWQRAVLLLASRVISCAIRHSMKSHLNSLA